MDAGRTDPEFAQPALFALQVALAALWRSWGVVPDAVIGHSLGEVAAAHVAGALSLPDAARLVVARGRLTREVDGLGRTAAVGLSPSEAARRVDRSGGRLALAAANGPGSSAISGDPEAVAALVADLEAAGVFARVLEGGVAFHGPQMDPIRIELERELAGLAPSAAAVPIVSTVTGEPIDGRSLGADYWGRNLRETVRFADALAHVGGEGRDVFLEIGPHPALAASIAEVLREAGREAPALASLRRGQDGPTTTRRTLAALYARGWPVAWPDAGRGYRKLPAYPWRRERHWFEAEAPASNGNGHKAHANGSNGNGHAKAEAGPGAVADLLYEVRWEELAPPAAPVAAAPGRWLIFEDENGVGRALRASLEARGERPEPVRDLAEIAGPIRGVVDLRPLDRSGPEMIRADGGCGEARVLARSVAAIGGARLWLATLGAQPAGPGGLVADPSGAILWGLARSIALESPATWGGIVDLDPAGPLADVEALADRLLGADGEDQVAFRGGRAHGPRLARVAAEKARKPASPPRPDGTYLVTGGLGDLGLKAARWLVDRGARRVVLLGRRGLPPRPSWDDLPEGHPLGAIVEAIRAMERIGATVVVAPVDVADGRRMAALFERLATLLPPIRGIIHAAGVVGDGDPAAVLRPKVAGTLVLHELARSLPLDFLVAFSSAAATLGAKEGAYAAANRFLDAYAPWAAAQGVPALAVGWGPWGGEGMAAHRSRAHKLLGLEPLATDRALDALGRLIAAGERHAVVADFDWFTFRMVYDGRGRSPLLEGIEDRPRAEATPAGPRPIDLWRTYPPEHRREELIRYFRDRVAGVLRLEPDRVDPDRPLDAMGLDSLMAIELKSGVEADLGTTLPLTSLLEGPTIAELADRAMEPPSSESPPITPGELAAIGPASAGQRSLWALNRRFPDDAAYNMAGAARIHAKVDVEALRRAIQGLVDRHDSLRTTFVEVDGSPARRVQASAEAWFRAEDASAWTEADLQARLVAEARRPFDLEAGPLFRTSLLSTGPEDHRIVFSMHHVVGDFWSIAILLDELGPLYAAALAGTSAGLPAPALTYGDYARWQADRLGGPEGDAARAYWAGRLAGPLPVLDLPTDRPRPAVRSQRGATLAWRLDPDLTRRLAALGSARGASLYVTLLASFQVLLGRLAGQDDVIVGSPAAGRDRSGLAGVVGYFANPLPIRVDLAGEPSFADVLARARAAAFEGLDHQDLPFAEMVERFAPGRDPGRPPIFGAMFAYQKAQVLDAEGLTPFVLRGEGDRAAVAGLPLESVALDLGISQFDLTLSAAEVDGGLLGTIEYSTDLFDPETIARILGRFKALLGSIAADPDAPISALGLLPADEREAVLGFGDGMAAEIPRHATIHALIEEQAARTPDAVAVACDGASLTYRDLDARANRLARHLRALGVGPDSRVGLGVDRSVEMVVGVLGILKAGGAYVPLDPEYPAERLRWIAEDAGLAALLTLGRLRGRMPEGSAPVVLLDADFAAGDGTALGPISGPGDLAYIIYTSGSTGRPKGVPVEHRNLVASTLARRSYYGEPVGAFLLASSFAFDSSVAGLFWTLVDGGRLVIPRAGDHADPTRLADLAADEGVTHWLGVPSLLGLILSETPADRWRSLRVAIVAGEACPRDLPARVRAAWPSAALHNEYGPTEATVWATAHDCRDDDGSAPVPIGRPIVNARAYVLDGRLGPVPIGVAGELYIGGAGVARGYLDRPALTAEKFLPDPFSTDPGARIYRSGDLARWRGDGRLEFLGRADHQLKVRGHRVEPGEVEAALRLHPSVADAAVLAREVAPGEARLVGYVVPRGDDRPTPADLRRWLRARLPESHVPTSFVAIDALPLTPNGKLDRDALPAPEVAPAPATVDEPRDPAEATLAGLLAGVLGRERVGIHEDLFDLGIDSILAIQLVSRARQAGLALDPGQVFEYPTVAGLAAVALVPGRPEGPPHQDGPAEGSVGQAFLPASSPEIEDEYPLSPMQEGMLFHSRISPESGVYVQQFSAPIAGDLQAGAFADAWRAVIARHPVLRTAFEGLDDGRPRQVVRRSVDLPLVFEDWRGSGPIGHRFEGFLRDDRDRGFDPATAPLLRLALIRTGEAEHRLVFSNHHALMDGWCAPIVLGEVLACYEAATEGREAALPPARPYRDYIDWLAALDRSGEEAHWRRVLRGFRRATPIPVGPPEGEAPDFAERTVRLSRRATDAVGAMARAHRVTLGTIVPAAWAVLLGRYSGLDEVAFGVTVSGRPAGLAGVESMVGLFINTLPARVGLPDEAPLGDWLASLQGDLVELRRHEATPLVRVQGWSDVPRGRPLFESIVVVANTPDDPDARARADRLGVGEVRAAERTNFPMTIRATPGARLALTAAFDGRRFGAGAVDRMLGHLAHLLGEMAAHPGARLADLSLAAADEAATPRTPARRPRNGAGGTLPAGIDRLSDEEVEAMLAELSSEEGATFE